MLVGSKILASINSDLCKLGNNRMLANETGEAKVKIITNLVDLSSIKLFDNQICALINLAFNF